MVLRATREIGWEDYSRDRRAKQVLYMEMVRELGRQFDLLVVRSIWPDKEDPLVKELTGVVLEDGDNEVESIKQLRTNGAIVAWMSFDDELAPQGRLPVGCWI